MALYVNPFVPAGAPEAPAGESGRMLQIITGLLCTQVVRAAAVHGLADRAADGDVTAAGFAAAAGLDPDASARFLRAAVAVGLLDPSGPDAYRGTALLDTLRSDREDSLRDLAVFMADDVMARTWGELPEVLRTGRAGAERAFGSSLFEHLSAHPDQAETFTRGMTAATWGITGPISASIDLAGVRSVVDVGGADGTLLRAVLRDHPDVTGTVFDLPHVVPAAVAANERAGLAGRIGVVAGDFFTDPVPSADLCLIKAVLHDWSDDEAVAILTRCRDAVAPGGRVAVLEQIIGDTGGIGPMLDLTMLVATPGRERTLEEFRAVLGRAGLVLDEVVDNGTAIRVLLASPAPG